MTTIKSEILSYMTESETRYYFEQGKNLSEDQVLACMPDLYFHIMKGGEISGFISGKLSDLDKAEILLSYKCTTYCSAFIMDVIIDNPEVDKVKYPCVYKLSETMTQLI